MKDNIVYEKSLNFSERIYKLSKLLKEKHKEFHLSDQILGSGTSIGANICEANTAQSKKDFISKISIALKEAEETRYWLLLLNRFCLINPKQFGSIDSDCFEIVKLLTKIRSTAKNKVNRNG